MGDESERLAFVKAICAEPACDTARLVYADWLDEHGESERAEFIRVQVGLARETAGWEPGNLDCLDMYLDPQDREGQEWKHRVWALQKRERALLQPNWALWMPEVAGPRACGNRDCFPKAELAAGGAHTIMTYRRGFVEEIACAVDTWLEHCDALVWRKGQTETCPVCLCRDSARNDNMRRFGGLLCTQCGTHHPPGRVPRPCPETAQPVTRVTFTTGTRIAVGPGALDEAARAYFRHLLLPGAAPFLVGAHGTHSSATWPGIEFTITPPA